MGNTIYHYDAVANPTNMSYPVSHGITLGYDKLNRLTNMVDALGTSLYAYDGAGQLLSETGPWTGVSVSNTYANRLRQASTVKTNGAAAWAQSYYYDPARRLTNVTSGAGAFAYQFAPGVQGLPSMVTLPNGASIVNSYDTVARVKSTALKNSLLANLDCHLYYYNLAGQRTTQSRLYGDYVNYTYDNAGQLKTARGAESGGSPSRLQEQFGYNYDAAGSLGCRTNNALIETFAVNSANELATAAPSGTLTLAGGTVPSATNVTVSGDAGGTAALYHDSTWALPGVALPNGSATYIATARNAQGGEATASVGVTLPATVSYIYDGNGNLISDGNRNFAYDDSPREIKARGSRDALAVSRVLAAATSSPTRSISRGKNRLTSVWVTNVWRTDFAYDGKMRLRQRTERAWNGSGWSTNSTVRYVYDGNVVVQEQDQNNASKVSYTRGRDLSGSQQGAGGIGGLLARSDNTAVTHAYYFADGNGNITCMIDTNQAVVATYLYDPYGRILSQSGPLAAANLYRF